MMNLAITTFTAMPKTAVLPLDFLHIPTTTAKQPPMVNFTENLEILGIQDQSQETLLPAQPQATKKATPFFTATPVKNLSRTEWLELRQTGIGGSDISAIMGENPHKTAYDVYQEKINPANEEMSEYAYWGITLEDTIAKEYAKRNNTKVQRVNYMLRHSEHEFAIANIDRAIVNPEVAGRVSIKKGTLTTDKILEIKTASEYIKNNWGEENTDHIPDHYNLQCQWYMGITGIQECDLALLIGGNKFRQYTIKFDPELFDMMIEVAKDFWENNVLAGVEPTPTTLANAKHKYAKSLPDSTLELSENDDENIAIIDRYIGLKDQAKQLDSQIEQVQVELINLIGENENLAIDGEIIFTYKMGKPRETFDKKACLKSYPELASKFSEFTKIGNPIRTLHLK
ncbi:YqaJ viral recombinase family protein [Moraxella boevrei]|uniref:YqaJ viral recombinase family nuclease n=1 Tax=Faucicola boevrei TaxID=346665 RepID=UPI003735D394